jgi:outer membrane protein OmpA-like peptidoglycan-associated protein
MSGLAQAGETAPPAEAAAGGAASSELGQLRRLLFAPEQAKLEALQGQCAAFAEKIGDEARFERATARVLAGALRKAEVAGHRELSAALAPLVVAAIRSEIVNSRDMMVDALYPITGRLVAASVANAFRDLAESLQKRIDSLLSSRIWTLRLRALLTRRPLSEVLLEAARRPQVVRLLALERGSGVLLACWRADGQQDESAELVGGLISAISAFAVQAFSREHGELRQLDLGSSRILLRASARTLVAAEFSGVPESADERRMDAALDALVGAGEPFDAEHLARLANNFAPAAPAAPSALSRWILAGALTAALAGALYLPVRDALRAHRIETAFAAARGAQDLAGWPLDLAVDHAARRVLLRGLVPPHADLEKLAAALAPSAAPYRLEMRVARVADPEAAARAQASAESGGAALAARLAKTEAALAALENWRAEREARDNAPAARLARLASASAIAFGDETDLREPEKARATIAALAQALKASGAALRVVGYSDASGSESKNHEVSLARAKSVVKMLVAAGVAPERLTAVGRGDAQAIVDTGEADSRRNRRVAFEPLQSEAAP